MLLGILSILLAFGLCILYHLLKSGDLTTIGSGSWCRGGFSSIGSSLSLLGLLVLLGLSLLSLSFRLSLLSLSLGLLFGLLSLGLLLSLGSFSLGLGLLLLGLALSFGLCGSSLSLLGLSGSLATIARRGRGSACTSGLLSSSSLLNGTGLSSSLLLGGSDLSITSLLCSGGLLLGSSGLSLGLLCLSHGGGGFSSATSTTGGRGLGLLSSLHVATGALDGCNSILIGLHGFLGSLLLLLIVLFNGGLQFLLSFGDLLVKSLRLLLLLFVGTLDNVISLFLGSLFLGHALVSLFLLLLLLTDLLSLLLVVLLLSLVCFGNLLVHLCDDLSVSLVLGSLLCSINNSFVDSLHRGSHLLFLADNSGNHGFLGGNGDTSSDILTSRGT